MSTIQFYEAMTNAAALSTTLQNAEVKFNGVGVRRRDNEYYIVVMLQDIAEAGKIPLTEGEFDVALEFIEGIYFA